MALHCSCHLYLLSDSLGSLESTFNARNVNVKKRTWTIRNYYEKIQP